MADEGADWGACVTLAKLQFCCDAPLLPQSNPTSSTREVVLVQGGSISAVVLGLLYSFQERLVSPLHSDTHYQKTPSINVSK